MPKLLWVLLPLVAAAAWLAWQWLRRRPPGRHALNIGVSLLLLSYVLTTAGLGIFWVANQQLPVFDWHYLFGYATLLLLALHLSFNARIVWRYFVRPRAVAAPVRRRGLGLTAALLGMAAAYALGLRQGRQGNPSLASQPAPVAFAAVERFHALSSNSRRGVLRAPGVDWGDAPPPFKRLAARPALRLPAPRSTGDAGFDLQVLATLLWHVAGITDDGAVLRLRASPSSGALFATELYVAAAAVDGLAPELWHYDAAAHGLQPLAGEPSVVRALADAADGSADGAAALVLATAVFRRSGHKYRDRTYRYVLADLGHALENLRVTALRCGLQPYFVQAFDEARCAELLRLDTAEEGVLALLALRPAGAAAPAASAAGWTPPPPAQAGAPLGLTGAMHAASSLRRGSVPSPTPATVSRAAAAPAQVLVLPRVAPADADVLQLIAQRRSRRRYTARPLSLPALSGVLAAMADPATLLPGQTLHIHVVAHAVEGLAPGAYRYQAADHALQPRRVGADLRSAARAAALDQDVIGDAAVVFVLAIAPAALRGDPLGPARAYRHALLHAGCIGERIYLEAGARGLGVCAVGAFHDDEATALVGADAAAEWIVHFAALGHLR
jgi:SagB-type dehydrogenase family enzyme